MKSCWRGTSNLLVSMVLLSLHIATVGDPAIAQECTAGFLRSSISGEENRVDLSLQRQTPACGDSGIRSISVKPQPYFTHEIACSTDRLAAAEGLCSATPCRDLGRFFAFRTIHRPDGTSAPAGFSCVSLQQAAANPGITVAQVFEAVRRVKLPGGKIGVEPGVRGLANLESYFWVEGVEQPPVDLQVGGSTVHAEFRVVEYRWEFGEGEPLVTTGPGRPSDLWSLASERLCQVLGGRGRVRRPLHISRHVV
jgi:hypothetical protein